MQAALTQFVSDILGTAIKPNIKVKSDRIIATYDVANDSIYGVIFSKLDKSDKVELIDENQLVTEQGSNIIYQSVSSPRYLLSLCADYINEKYSLVVSCNKE